MGAARNSSRSKGEGKGKQCIASRFSLINSRLICVAKDGKPDVLLKIIAEDLPKMNFVNLSTALHRLAKLTGKSAHKVQFVKAHTVFDLIVTSVRHQLAMRQPRCPVPQPQALSNTAWALATLQHVDLPLLEMCASLATKQVSSFKPFELSSILWAFASFEVLEPAACACATSLFLAAAKLLPDRVEDFSFRCLVMIVWAFATAGHHDEKLFMSLAERMARTAHTANRQDLGNAAWAFSHAGFYHVALFSELSSKWPHHDVAERTSPSECSTGEDTGANEASSFSSEEVTAQGGQSPHWRSRPMHSSCKKGTTSEAVFTSDGFPSTFKSPMPSYGAMRREDQHEGDAYGANDVAVQESSAISFGEPSYIRLEDLSCKPPVPPQGLDM
eukprot:TRINITY_DN14258_c0_g1_i1.p1 TRINITY_DN14258_c0_g1~~TRINITY_DN14258_c0_g1_i1.p1  ORF type:complete len:387 (+),score=49.95 TRINITY_DN14258_c0_g1_i1:19-1179(+)